MNAFEKGWRVIKGSEDYLPMKPCGNCGDPEGSLRCDCTRCEHCGDEFTGEQAEQLGMYERQSGMVECPKCTSDTTSRPSEEYSMEDDLCCGISARQAVDGSWNYCPFCAERIPSGVKRLYDYVM